MAEQDWDGLITEMDSLMDSRDEILDRLDYITGVDRSKKIDKVTLLRMFIIINYSRTKTVYKNYGFKATVHAVYDYAMAQTYFKWKEKREAKKDGE